MPTYVFAVADRVLVPFDGSPYSEKVLEYALGLSAVSLTLLAVVDPFDVDPERLGFQSPTGVAGLPGLPPEWYEKARDAARERLAEACERAAESTISCSSTVCMGRPARQIVAYTTENDVDQVVTGTHGRPLVSRVPLGSVAETVVRRSPVPVTVVR